MARRPARSRPAPRTHHRSAPRRAAERVAATGDRVAVAIEASGVDRTADEALERGQRLAARAARQAATVEHALAKARESTAYAIYRTTAGAHAVAETSRRAAVAPPRIAHEVKAAGSALARGVTRTVAWYAVGGLLLLAAAIAFTVALASALNLWLGTPWGTVIVGALYGAAGAACIVLARKRQSRSAGEYSRHVAQARREVEHVLEPVQRWAGRRPKEPHA